MPYILVTLFIIKHTSLLPCRHSSVTMFTKMSDILPFPLISLDTQYIYFYSSLLFIHSKSLLPINSKLHFFLWCHLHHMWPLILSFICHGFWQSPFSHSGFSNKERLPALISMQHAIFPCFLANMHVHVPQVSLHYSK